MMANFKRQYIGWDKARIEKHLIYLKQKLSDNLGICEANVEYYIKHISFLTHKLTKL
jgi:hypothetical protein